MLLSLLFEAENGFALFMHIPPDPLRSKDDPLTGLDKLVLNGVGGSGSKKV